MVDGSEIVVWGRGCGDGDGFLVVDVDFEIGGVLFD